MDDIHESLLGNICGKIKKWHGGPTVCMKNRWARNGKLSIKTAIL